jgi:hypothetical protein
MKSINILVLVFSITANILLQSCSNCINNNGAVVTVERQVAAFSSVSFGTEGTIYVKQDSFTSISIVADQEVINDMVTEVNGGELTIYNKHCLRNPEPITIYVTTPNLNGIKMSGSGNMYVTSGVSAQSFNITLSGSGTINCQQEIDAAGISSNISGSGSIDLIANCTNMNSIISGSGNITINGNSPTHVLNISGSGSIFSYGFITDVTNVTISGSGNAELFVNDLLDVTISGSGNVYYKGDATVTTHISGSGNVTHVN